MVDYYRVLGVSRDASSEEIKAAFRRLALKFHPDRHANESKSAQKSASESFREVKEAYEVLGNDRQRDVYNRSGYGYSSPGSPYSSAYSSAREARTAYERASQHSRYTSEQKQTTSAGGFKSDWSYKTSYRGRYDRSVRWGWQPPMEGPKLVFRATLFGMAVVTLMMIQPAIDSAWRRKNVGKSYEEMLERVRRRKRTDESHS